jgi:hypothetical protein
MELYKLEVLSDNAIDSYFITMYLPEKVSILLEINSGDHLGSSRTVSESMNICL